VTQASSSIFSVPPPDRPVERWHVAPAVDVAAYAMSWIWVLVPLAMLPDPKAEWLGLYILVLVVTDVHRHYGLPYVYLDREVFSRFRLRFVLFPALMLLAWAASPWLARHARPVSAIGIAGIVSGVILLVQILRRDRDGEPPSLVAMVRALGPAAAMLALGLVLSPREPGWAWLLAAAVGTAGIDVHLPLAGQRRFVASGAVVALALALAGMSLSGHPPQGLRMSAKDALNLAAVAAGAWNIWHVLMQKYGILRMYSAKSGREAKVPGWVDRLLVFGFIPLLLIWVGPANRDAALTGFDRGAKVLVPFLDALARAQPYLLVPCIALAVGAVAAFVGHERRTHGLRNAPRLWMAAGTTMLALAFFFVHPIKVYLAYAFSHAVEYMVFVWAYQRRRYAEPHDPEPLLSRVLKRPWLAYGGFIVVGGVLVVWLKYYGRTIFRAEDQPYFLGITTAEWFMYWGVYQSMVHFYFDGFLWKMRRKATRAHL
jgi:uncharacterized membrane protein